MSLKSPSIDSENSSDRDFIASDEDLPDLIAEYHDSSESDDNNPMKKKRRLNPNVHNALEEAEKHLKNKKIQIVSQIEHITNLEDRSKFWERYLILENMQKPSTDFMTFRDKLAQDLDQYFEYGMNHFSDKYQNLKKELILVDTAQYSLEHQIFCSDMSKEQMAIVYYKYQQFQLMKPENEEYVKMRDWLISVLRIPFQKTVQINLPPKKNISQYLVQVRKQLDTELYGASKAKESVLLMLNTIITHPKSNNHIIALLGPPGVGKTMLARSLAKCLSLPFHQLSLGGINHVGFLKGDSYAFIGSKYGKLIDAIITMQARNGIIFLDEIDKLGKSNTGEEVASSLLHILDPSQNSEFVDNYLPELPVDLSQVWWIVSLNDENQINPILRDRLNIIKMPGYSVKEKIQIGLHYLLPQQLKNQGLNSKDIIIPPDIMAILIETYCLPEEGVRNLKRVIEEIVKKVSIWKNINSSDASKIGLSFKLDKIKLPLKINHKIIKELLD